PRHRLGVRLGRNRRRRPDRNRGDQRHRHRHRNHPDHRGDRSMSVTVYRSTDAGAPVLNGTSGNGLVNLFDICLVGSGTAYGSLPKKGWTKPFSGTNKGVYLTVDGGCYLRVMHDGSNTGGFREALVRAAEG